MPSILLAWELGSGLGHLAPLRAIGLELVCRGHQVAIAANNVPLCQQGFAGTGVEVGADTALDVAPVNYRINPSRSSPDLINSTLCRHEDPHSGGPSFSPFFPAWPRELQQRIRARSG